MPHLIDLQTIRRAQSNLDRIAADHPEYFQRQGTWTAHDVEELVMAKSAKQRVSDYRARMRSSGCRRLSIHLTPAAQEALIQLRQQHQDLSIDDLINAILTGQVQVPKNQTPSSAPQEQPR